MSSAPIEPESTADAADVPKTANQLKKEAKRLAKLEKFNKKQEQQSQEQKSAKEVKFTISANFIMQILRGGTSHILLDNLLEKNN